MATDADPASLAPSEQFVYAEVPAQPLTEPECAPLLLSPHQPAPAATPAAPAYFTITNTNLPRLVHVAYAALLIALVVCVLLQANLTWFLSLAVLALIPYCLDPHAPSVCLILSIAVVVVVCVFAVLNLGSLQITFVPHAGDEKNASNTTNATRA